MNILFVQPPWKEKKWGPGLIFRNYLTLGTLISALRSPSFLKKFADRTGKENISHLLEGSWIEVRLLDLSRPEKDLKIRDSLARFFEAEGFNPHMICTTATSAQVEEAIQLGNAAKELIPSCLRIIGGPHVTVLPEEFLQNSQFDIACLGEGVETIAELTLVYRQLGFRGLPAVRGIVFRDEGGVIHRNPPRSFCFSLDEYPHPSESLDLFLEGIDGDGKRRDEPVSILSGFGCPRRCLFCAQQAIHPGGIRERSADSLVDEMGKLFQKGFRRFALVQETFLGNADRVERFCNLLEASGLPLEWTIEAHAEEVSFPLLQRMRKAGLRFIQLGIESGDPQLLERLGKRTHLDQVIRLRDWCETLGIHTTFYFLVGLPGQDWPSILRSALFLQKHCPFNQATFHIAVSVAIPYPGTAIAKEGLVRWLNKGNPHQNWPQRNPDIQLGPEGSYVGTSETETDVMTPTDIFESYVFLDDLGFFLIQSKYNDQLSPCAIAKAREFADRNFYAIRRRTIRDLILRADPRSGPEEYRKNREEILRIDGNCESRLVDLVPNGEQDSEILNLFLTTVRFQNGFHVMKQLSIPHRIKWMMLCAHLWDQSDRAFIRIAFEMDCEEEGKALDQKLNSISMESLLSFLDRKEGIGSVKVGIPEILHDGPTICAWDLFFSLSSSAKILRVHRLDSRRKNEGPVSILPKIERKGRETN